MKNLLLALFISLLLWGCASNASNKSQSSPDWLIDPASAYPKETYLTAIGSGFSHDSAQKDAAAKLAQIFGTHISASEKIEKRYEELTKDGKSSLDEYTKLEKDISLSSQETLYNIQFGQSYTDNRGKVHVIGYLHRFQTGNIYQSMISTNSEYVLEYQKKAADSLRPLDKYAYSSAALAIALKNADLLMQYKIISPELSSLYQLPYQLNSLKENEISAARAITFSIDLNHAKNESVSSIIAASLSEIGFSTRSNQALLNIKGNLEISPTDLARSDNTVFLRWKLDLEIIDSQNTSILSFNYQGRSGSISEPEAQAKVYKDIEKKVYSNLNSGIINWFDNLALK